MCVCVCDSVTTNICNNAVQCANQRKVKREQQQQNQQSEAYKCIKGTEFRLWLICPGKNLHLTTVCYLLEVVLTTSVVCGSEQHGVLDDLLLTRHEHEKGANKKQKRRVLEDNSLRKEENNFFLPLAFGAIFQCKFSAKKCKKEKEII